MFAHFSAIKSTGFQKLNEGDEIEFDVQQGQNGKGSQAANIVVTQAAPEGSHNNRPQRQNRW